MRNWRWCNKCQGMFWGGNVTNENISLKHFLNVTWVSRPIPEDRPSEQELFGDFYEWA